MAAGGANRKSGNFLGQILAKFHLKPKEKGTRQTGARPRESLRVIIPGGKTIFTRRVVVSQGELSPGLMDVRVNVFEVTNRFPSC